MTHLTKCVSFSLILISLMGFVMVVPAMVGQAKAEDINLLEPSYKLLEDASGYIDALPYDGVLFPDRERIKNYFIYISNKEQWEIEGQHPREIGKGKVYTTLMEIAAWLLERAKQGQKLAVFPAAEKINAVVVRIAEKEKYDGKGIKGMQDIVKALDNIRRMDGESLEAIEKKLGLIYALLERAGRLATESIGNAKQVKELSEVAVKTAEDHLVAGGVFAGAGNFDEAMEKYRLAHEDTTLPRQHMEKAVDILAGTTHEQDLRGILLNQQLWRIEEPQSMEPRYRIGAAAALTRVLVLFQLAHHGYVLVEDRTYEAEKHIKWALEKILGRSREEISANVYQPPDLSEIEAIVEQLQTAAENINSPLLKKEEYMAIVNLAADIAGDYTIRKREIIAAAGTLPPDDLTRALILIEDGKKAVSERRQREAVRSFNLADRELSTDAKILIERAGKELEGLSTGNSKIDLKVKEAQKELYLFTDPGIWEEADRFFQVSATDNMLNLQRACGILNMVRALRVSDQAKTAIERATVAIAYAIKRLTQKAENIVREKGVVISSDVSDEVQKAKEAAEANLLRRNTASAISGYGGAYFKFYGFLMDVY